MCLGNRPSVTNFKTKKLAHQNNNLLRMSAHTDGANRGLKF